MLCRRVENTWAPKPWAYIYMGAPKESAPDPSLGLIKKLYIYKPGGGGVCKTPYFFCFVYRCATHPLYVAPPPRRIYNFLTKQHITPPLGFLYIYKPRGLYIYKKPRGGLGGGFLHVEGAPSFLMKAPAGV